MRRLAGRRQLLGALTALTVLAIAPLARADGTGKSLAIEIDAGSEGQELLVWTSYALGLANWAKDNGALAQAPLGVLVPSFEGELAARQTLLAIWREIQEKQQRPMPYMDALLRVDAAGYLREYVWTVHWRSSWKQPPAGLRIADFYAWQRQELAGHEPRTGSRVRVIAAP